MFQANFLLGIVLHINIDIVCGINVFKTNVVTWISQPIIISIHSCYLRIFVCKPKDFLLKFGKWCAFLVVLGTKKCIEIQKFNASLFCNARQHPYYYSSSESYINSVYKFDDISIVITYLQNFVSIGYVLYN